MLLICPAGEAKRRTLPLWLREELEKLERKKAKQLEREAREGEVEAPKSWAEELERETEMEGVREGEGRWGVEEEEEEVGKVKTRNYRSHSSSRVSVSACMYTTVCVTENPCGAKRKRAELWTAVSGLLAVISRA